MQSTHGQQRGWFFYRYVYPVITIIGIHCNLHQLKQGTATVLCKGSHL